ncbi:hypothetical protein [Zhongshania marina]|uniref:Uncharacterized protein n=1 Tax=Zhongshania marina TaxID=2304603 RepID=A0A2S4HC78_9GAMM|nr:hypothetical protein [Marortus luteolus]POP51570.1 hypothetical protein C0068_16675 [Marortus luteolus]
MEPFLGIALILGSLFFYDQNYVQPDSANDKPTEYRYEQDTESGRRPIEGNGAIHYGSRVKHWMPGENYFISDLSLESLPVASTEPVPERATTKSSVAGVRKDTPRSQASFDPTAEFQKQSRASTNKPTPQLSSAEVVLPRAKSSCTGEVTTIYTSDLDTPRHSKNEMLVREAVFGCS